MGRKAHPLAARIKKMMQMDEDVGKISQATPVMIARAMELFLQRLCSKSADIAGQRKAKTLTTSHLKAYVASDELMDFLKDTVAKAPDLPPEGEAEAPKPKRQRTGVEWKRDGKRASADGAAAAAAAAAQPAAADSAAPAATATAAPAAAAPAPAAAPAAAAPQVGVPQHVRGDEAAHASGSPTAAAAQAKLGHGFGGLGAHPFLAARSFGKPSGLGGARAKGSTSCSPKPESPRHKQQQPVQQQQQQRSSSPGAAAAAAPGISPLQQLGSDPVAGLPGLPGLNPQLLATMAQAAAAEDDYDEEY